VVSDDEEVSGVARYAGRYFPQIFRNAFDRERGFRTLAAGWTHRCARGEQPAQQPENKRAPSKGKHGENQQNLINLTKEMPSFSV